MDASLVYGSTPETAAALRQGFGGRLVVEVRDGRQWPPPAVNKSATCETQDDDEPCYRFGMFIYLLSRFHRHPLYLGINFNDKFFYYLSCYH